MSADSPYSVGPQKGRQRHKMQWKKSDKEGRGIDQRHHLTSPPSTVRSWFNFSVGQPAESSARWQWVVLCRRHSPAGVSEYEVQAHLQLPPTVHCQLHYVAAAVHSALHRALQARAASDGEYESAAAPCWIVPVQKYKLQAATNTFQLHF